MDQIVLLNHGSGGKMTHDLIKNIFVRYFDNPVLNKQTDSAIIEINSRQLAFTTDSYVVSPVFFPGGNIGKLAVCGTVNDLAVSGARPLYLSCGFILEEGLLVSDLEEIVRTMAGEAEKAGVLLVTGDTKVVEKGKADKLFINTSGIGTLDDQFRNISFGTDVKAGDKIIINGNIGDHGAAILCARNALEYNSDVRSDCAALNHLIRGILDAGYRVNFMRDATRGGLATVLCEFAEQHKHGVILNEDMLPVQESVRGLCEAFGFDPLFMANEGKVVIIAHAADADNIITMMRQDEHGKNAAIIGEITEIKQGKVILKTGIGSHRVIDIPAGEQLPRIC